MERQFRLRCKQILDVQRTFEWSSNYEVTTEIASFEIVISQPAEGSEKLKPMQCPNCGASLKVTIRSEADAKKRAFFIWTAFALCWLFAVPAFLFLIKIAESVLVLLIPFIPVSLSVFLFYFGLPSQLRATLYDANGNIILDDTEHELSEFQTAD